jgi:hypothetical protein
MAEPLIINGSTALIGMSMERPPVLGSCWPSGIVSRMTLSLGKVLSDEVVLPVVADPVVLAPVVSPVLAPVVSPVVVPVDAPVVPVVPPVRGIPAPLGSQSGLESTVLLVILVGEEPSALIRQISLSPKVSKSGSLTKAISVPSGDQTGCMSWTSAWLVRFTPPEPSAFIAYMSYLPPVFLSYAPKTIFEPLGRPVRRLLC